VAHQVDTARIWLAVSPASATLRVPPEGVTNAIGNSHGTAVQWLLISHRDLQR